MTHILFGFILLLYPLQTICITILFDLVGNAYSSGRIIQESFERGITLAYAEAVQKQCTQFCPNLSILIVNPAGSQFSQLEKAQRINSMHGDLIISFHCYQEDISPSLYIYQYGYEPLPAVKTDTLIWCPYNKAYTLNFSKTNTYAKILTTVLSESPTNKSFCIHGPFVIPLTPLIGILTPALLLELGLTTAQSWQDFVDAFAQALMKLAMQL